MLLEKIAIADQVLEEHRAALGGDRVAYGNHVYRVANLAAVLAAAHGDAEKLDKIAIAAVFHDLGIWTDRTFDYLGPSIARARAYLEGSGREGWIPEISAMIDEHHKIGASRQGGAWLVEVFRRADWIDVSRGLLSFGVPRAVRREIGARWPSAGFHRRLVQLSLKRLATHPLHPLPMFRL